MKVVYLIGSFKFHKEMLNIKKKLNLNSKGQSASATSSMMSMT